MGLRCTVRESTSDAPEQYTAFQSVQRMSGMHKMHTCEAYVDIKQPASIKRWGKHRSAIAGQSRLQKHRRHAWRDACIQDGTYVGHSGLRSRHRMRHCQYFTGEFHGSLQISAFP